MTRHGTLALMEPDEWRISDVYLLRLYERELGCCCCCCFCSWQRALCFTAFLRNFVNESVQVPHVITACLVFHLHFSIHLLWIRCSQSASVWSSLDLHSDEVSCRELVHGSILSITNCSPLFTFLFYPHQPHFKLNSSHSRTSNLLFPQSYFGIFQLCR